jgi:uroporphyrin-III C-methyltransferase
MTEDPQPGGDRPAYQPVVPPRRRRDRSRPLYWLVVLLTLAAIGYGGWRGMQWATGTLHTVSSQQELIQRLSGELGALRARADELAARQTDLTTAVQRNDTGLAALSGRIGESEQAMARLSDTVEGGRTRLQLAAVEQLMLMANDRLLLARDASGALKALDLADQRLALVNDPRLFRTRETLAQERAALATLALPDYTGLALTLAELMKRVPQLPLRTRVPERFETQPQAEVMPAEPGVLGRIWVAVKTALSSLFAVRRNTGAAPRLLGPDEEALVVQILRLKLEGARLALLAGDAPAFRELCVDAAGWLTQYYDETDANVRAVQAELERINHLKLAAALPDISRSLTLLRAQLGAPSR